MPKIIAADVPQEILDEINMIDWGELSEKKIKDLVEQLRTIIKLKKLPKRM